MNWVNTPNAGGVVCDAEEPAEAPDFRSAMLSTIFHTLGPDRSSRCEHHHVCTTE